MAREEGPFISWRWVLISLALFVLIEIAVGVGVGRLVSGRYLSMGTSFWIRGSVQWMAFFLGGGVVGAISPSVRILEPAVAAFAAVGLTLLATLFTPYGFLHMGGARLALAGGIAFALAMAGAWMGERLAGRLP